MHGTAQSKSSFAFPPHDKAMIPEDLITWRQQRGFTQAAAAAFLNTPLGTYRRWEQGSRRIPGIVDTACYARRDALEDAAQIIDAAAKAASKEGDLKRKREYEFRAVLIREL